MNDDPMVFERRDGKVYVLGVWRERINVSGSLARDPNPEYLTLEGDVLRIRVANGQAVYRVTEGDKGRDELTCELQYSEWEPAP